MTYRALFANSEFRALFVARFFMMVSAVMSTFALGVVMFDATHSSLLTALAMFGGPLVQLVTAQFLLSASDVLRPRTALVITASVEVVVDALQLLPGLPWAARFALIAVMHVVLAATGGTTVALLSDILPGEAFVLGRATLNLTVSGVQIIGNVMGALLLIWTRPTNIFLISALASLVAAGAIRGGLSDHPSRAPESAGGLVGRTRQINAALFSSRTVRPILLMSWVPSGFIVGCEALYIPYARAESGYLYAGAAVGMLTGDVVVGRFVSEKVRQRLVIPLQTLLAVPFLSFFLHPPVWVAAILGGVGALGYASALPLQERLVQQIDASHKGQAFGLLQTGTMVGQAVGALSIGALAQFISPAAAITVAAGASLLATVAWASGLRRSDLASISALV